MKTFIIKILLFGLFAAGCIFGFLYYYHVTQIATIDPFYRRFTTGKYPSLLLGSSRTAQALRPQVFDKELKNSFDTPFFNYSFTIGSSNIGPTYLKKIKKRIKKSENSLFVLCVDPWILSRSKEDVNDTDYKENKTFFARQLTQNMSPNIEYLLFHDNKNQSFFKKIFEPDSSIYYLHKNGWLQVNYDITTKEAEANRNWQMVRLQDEIKKLALSEKRFESLGNMISFLKTKGTVVILRLPTSEKMKDMEQTAFPDFDSKILSVTQKYKVSYLNLIKKSGEYQTVDGNHIFKDETERLSEDICKMIQGNRGN